MYGRGDATRLRPSSQGLRLRVVNCLVRLRLFSKGGVSSLPRAAKERMPQATTVTPNLGFGVN